MPSPETNTQGPDRRDVGFDDLLRPRKLSPLIALEEHISVPYDVPATSKTWTLFEPKFMEDLKARLGDVDLRLKIMDYHNIAAQIMSLTQPTTQSFSDAAQAAAFAKKSNEFLYQNYVVKHPKRFFGFAALPTQDGKLAAQELERCIKEYGFVGAMINGWTATDDPEVGKYLDSPDMEPLWDVAEKYETPIFLHPRSPVLSSMRNLDDYPALAGPTYGFGRETVEHCLRLMCSGLFDRHPKLKIVLGHMGEGLSWILPRTDARLRLYKQGLRSSTQLCCELTKTFRI